MEEFKPVRRTSDMPSNNLTTTTLIIQDVPSDIAYRTIMGAFQEGRLATKEEIKEALGIPIEKTTETEMQKETNNFHQEERNIFSYEERNIISHEYKEIEHNLSWRQIGKTNGQIIQECRCCDCGAILGHRILSEGKEQLLTDFETVKDLFKGVQEEKEITTEQYEHSYDERFGYASSDKFEEQQEDYPEGFGDSPDRYIEEAEETPSRSR